MSLTFLCFLMVLERVRCYLERQESSLPLSGCWLNFHLHQLHLQVVSYNTILTKVCRHIGNGIILSIQDVPEISDVLF